MKKSVIIGIFVIVLIVIIIFLYSQQNYFLDKENKEKETELGPENIKKISEQEIPYKNADKNNLEHFTIPENLALPFDVEDMNGGNKFVSPFGLLRHERDKGQGHPGIDIPLSQGNNIYAVSNGEIISNEPSSDGPGNDVILLLIKSREGEGWAFLYEHINLNSEINLNTKVSKGQLIGKTAINSNNHLGLVYYFNNFKYTQESKCWVDHLANEDKQKLLNTWEIIKNNPQFIESWRNAFEDNAYAYRALLNKERFPLGPQLCYEYGLDVREFS